MEKSFKIIAEIAGGHMGNVDRCIELVNAAGKSGADCVKFQFYKACELCELGHKDYDLFKSLEFEISDWEKIFKTAREFSMLVYADIFGKISFDEATLLGVDGYKLHAADLDNIILINEIIKTQKTIFLGVGGHKRVEIYHTLKKIREASKECEIVLMPGHQLFPTPVNEHSLEEIKWFCSVYNDMNVKCGCADHIDGDDIGAVSFPLAALGAGALYIEKHITIDRKQKWEDYESAIEPDKFTLLSNLVRSIKNVSHDFPQWSKGRESYRRKSVKTYFTSNSIEKGQEIDLNNLKFLRPTSYCNPLPSDFISKNKTTSELKASQILNGKEVDQKVGILINCRTQSTRLPQKAIKKICGKETIALLIERAKFCKIFENIILCTTEHSSDDVLVEIAKRENIEIFRGPDENVALRLLLAAKKFNLQHIVRITGDDLLRDIPLIDEAVESHLKNNADYTSMDGVVYSCDTEIISVRALETIVERAFCSQNTEYLTWYLDDETAFVCNKINAPSVYMRPYRITLDTAQDFKMFEALYQVLYNPGQPIDLKEALVYLDKHPEIACMNSGVKPKLTRNDLDVRIKI